MHKNKWLTLIISLLGGSAVLGSYAVGLTSNPGSVDMLWGGVSESIRPYYTLGMFLAATGYFAFTYFILFRLPPTATRVANQFGYNLFNGLYVAILIPSALWLPLTSLAIEQSSVALVWLVRLVLALVALSSLGLFYALLKVTPRAPAWAHRLAVIGCVGFCIQTVLLDAIVWGSLFGV